MCLYSHRREQWRDDVVRTPSKFTSEMKEGLYSQGKYYYCILEIFPRSNIILTQLQSMSIKSHSIQLSHFQCQLNHTQLTLSHRQHQLSYTQRQLSHTRCQLSHT